MKGGFCYVLLYGGGSSMIKENFSTYMSDRVNIRRILRRNPLRWNKCPPVPAFSYWWKSRHTSGHRPEQIGGEITMICVVSEFFTPTPLPNLSIFAISRNKKLGKNFSLILDPRHSSLKCKAVPCSKIRFRVIITVVLKQGAIFPISFKVYHYYSIWSWAVDGGPEPLFRLVINHAARSIVVPCKIQVKV